MLMVAQVTHAQRLPQSMQKDDVHSQDLVSRVNIPRSLVPAVTHVDYSARVQTVDASATTRLRGLLSAFFDKTGCPVLVNTSFNIRGEPIVCTPADALRCFAATDMDTLVLGRCVVPSVAKRQILSAADRAAYIDQFDLD